MLFKCCFLFVLVSFIWLKEVLLVIEVVGRVCSRFIKVKMFWIFMLEKLFYSCVYLIVVSLFLYFKIK